MSEIKVGTLYELNKQVMMQLPPQDQSTLNKNLTLIGDWFGKELSRWFLLMCKEHSDFTWIHVITDNFYAAVQELKDVLASRGDIIAIQYIHGEDAFEIWVRNEEEAFVFMLFEAKDMIIEV